MMYYKLGTQASTTYIRESNLELFKGDAVMIVVDSHFGGSTPTVVFVIRTLNMNKRNQGATFPAICAKVEPVVANKVSHHPYGTVCEYDFNMPGGVRATAWSTADELFAFESAEAAHEFLRERYNAAFFTKVEQEL